MLVTVGRGDLTPPRNVVLRFSTGFMLEEFYHAERSQGLRGGAARNRPGNRYSGQRADAPSHDVFHRRPGRPFHSAQDAKGADRGARCAARTGRAHAAARQRLEHSRIRRGRARRGRLHRRCGRGSRGRGRQHPDRRSRRASQPHRTPGAAGRSYRRGVRGRHSGQPRRRGFHERGRV